MIEMQPWTKSSRRSPGGVSASVAGNSNSMGRENWPRVGLSTVINDARLHDALRSMYIPPSLLHIGRTIGRGQYYHHHLPQEVLRSVVLVCLLVGSFVRVFVNIIVRENVGSKGKAQKVMVSWIWFWKKRKKRKSVTVITCSTITPKVFRPKDYSQLDLLSFAQ